MVYYVVWIEDLEFLEIFGIIFLLCWTDKVFFVFVEKMRFDKKTSYFDEFVIFLIETFKSSNKTLKKSLQTFHESAQEIS